MMSRGFSFRIVASFSFALLGAGTWFAQTRNVASPGKRGPASLSELDTQESFPDTLAGISDAPFADSAAETAGAGIAEAKYSRFSFRALLLSKQATEVQRLFSKDCLAKIRAAYASGSNFATEFAKSRIVPIEEEKFRSGTWDREFHHYTDVPAMLKIARDQNVDAIFSHVRASGYPFVSFLFLAEDSKTSEGFGRYHLKLTIKSGAKIFDLRGKKAVIFQVWESLKKRYPWSEGCHGDPDDLPDGNYRIADALFYLSLEDSGVDLIDYKPANGGHYWYQLMNPFAVERMEVE